MIAALARAAQVLDEPRYAVAARRAADFVLSRLRNPDGALLKRFRDDAAGLPAHIEDYAFFIWGLLELYEATFDVAYLATAIELNGDLIERFWDDKHGGFFFTADDGEALIARTKEVYDGAIPSGNSVAMSNLLRLARITGDTKLEARAAAIGKAFSGEVARSPSAHTQLMCALDFGMGPSYEVVIAGAPESADTIEMLRALRQAYVPNKVVLLRPPGESVPIAAISPFTALQTMRHDRATAYVCRNHVCDSPTNDARSMIESLAKR